MPGRAQSKTDPANVSADAARLARRVVDIYWRSAVGVGAVVAVGIGLIVLLGALGVLSLTFIANRWNVLWAPAILALTLTTLAFLIGFAAAMPLGLVRVYGPAKLRRRKGAPPEVVSYARAKELYGTAKAIRVVGQAKLKRALLAPAFGVSSGYIEGIRGTPFYVQMFLVFYLVIFVFPDVPPDPFIFAGFLALTINTIGYQAEVLRAGFQSVGQGQIDAAKSIGMKGRQIFLHVTLPQAVRLIILPLTNEWISLFKASAILGVISVPELMFWGRQLGVNEGHSMEAFLMIAVMYLIINVPLSKAITYIERKKRIPGLGAQAEIRPTRIASMR